MTPMVSAIFVWSFGGGWSVEAVVAVVFNAFGGGDFPVNALLAAFSYLSATSCSSWACGFWIVTDNHWFLAIWWTLGDLNDKNGWSQSSRVMSLTKPSPSTHGLQIPEKLKMVRTSRLNQAQLDMKCGLQSRILPIDVGGGGASWEQCICCQLRIHVLGRYR
jgi:hypothetical protein